MSKKKLPVVKTIAERNVDFLKLSPKDQRLAIARDTIEQVLTDRYFVQTMIYFQLPIYDAEVVKENADLQGILLANIEEICTVCARGAIFASAVRLSNGVTLPADARVSYYNVFELYRGDKAFSAKEHASFDDVQLRLMECAFETDAEHADIMDNEDEDGITIGKKRVQDAIVFGNQWSDDRDRLLAIMQNVIDHDGEFVSKDLKTKLPVLDPSIAKAYAEAQKR